MNLVSIGAGLPGRGTGRPNGAHDPGEFRAMARERRTRTRVDICSGGPIAW
jgi:hypothetical protein